MYVDDCCSIRHLHGAAAATSTGSPIAMQHVALKYPEYPTYRGDDSTSDNYLTHLNGTERQRVEFIYHGFRSIDEDCSVLMIFALFFIHFLFILSFDIVYIDTSLDRFVLLITEMEIDDYNYGYDDSYPFRSRASANAMMGRFGGGRFRRQSRGVHDECCVKPCSVSELRSYCGGREQ